MIFYLIYVIFYKMMPLYPTHWFSTDSKELVKCIENSVK